MNTKTHMYSGRAALCGEPITAHSDVEWRGLLAVDCEACRAAILADKCAPPGWDPWNDPAARAAYAALEASIARDLRELKALADSVCPGGLQWS